MEILAGFFMRPRQSPWFESMDRIEEAEKTFFLDFKPKLCLKILASNRKNSQTLGKSNFGEKQT
jgi:hypothetical protein